MEWARMGRWQRAALVALLLAVACPISASAEETAEAVATVSFDLYVASLGVGVATGSGTLDFRGREYPFSVSALSLGDLGVASLRVTGLVYGMNEVSDFAGIYVGFEEDARLGGGLGSATVKNDKGVVADLVAHGEGGRIDFGPIGAKVRLMSDPLPLRMAR